MENLPLHIIINPDLYTKNPESSVLGQKIVSKSIEMIDALGFEDFTFKKLGLEIGSNESSVYRYFESKHALLVYLINWYWSWIEYKLVFSSTVKSPIFTLPKISSVYFAESNFSKPAVEKPPELKADKLISSFLKSVCFNKILAPLFNII